MGVNVLGGEYMFIYQVHISSASNHTQSSVILRKYGLKFGIRQ